MCFFRLGTNLGHFFLPVAFFPAGRGS